MGRRTKVCLRYLGHMTNMANTPMYDKNPSKVFLSLELVSIQETWYVALGAQAYNSLFK